MEKITLGQIGIAVAFVVALLTGIGVLKKQLKSLLEDLLKEQLDAITKKIDKLGDKIDAVDMESCKNFLVRFLSDVETGTPVDEIEKERFWEQYQHYEKIGGNSYIKQKVEQLRSGHKL